MMQKKYKIAVIGLGYVGLPLARLMATKYPVVGFDVNQERVDELNSGHDSTLEVEDEILKSVLVKNIRSVKEILVDIFEPSRVNKGTL